MDASKKNPTIVKRQSSASVKNKIVQLKQALTEMKYKGHMSESK